MLSTLPEQIDLISKQEFYAYFLYLCFNNSLSDGSLKNPVERVRLTASGHKSIIFQKCCVSKSF